MPNKYQNEKHYKWNGFILFGKDKHSQVNDNLPKTVKSNKTM